MSSATFVLITKDGNKICKECLLADGNNLSSLSSSLRALKGQANDTLSEIVTKEKSNTEGTAKRLENSESEPSEGKKLRTLRSIDLYARLQMRMTKNQMQRN